MATWLLASLSLLVWCLTQSGEGEVKFCPFRTHGFTGVAKAWLRNDSILKRPGHVSSNNEYHKDNSSPWEHPHLEYYFTCPRQTVFTHFYTSPTISHTTSRISQSSWNSQLSRIYGTWVVIDNRKSSSPKRRILKATSLRRRIPS